jgi:hypothetical protein
MNARRVTLVLGALAILAPGVARSDPPARPVSPQEPESRKVLRPGAVEIEGKVRKPTAPSITPPSLAIRPQPERRESFLSKIVEAVDKEPF